MIPEKAIEAAARAMSGHPRGWDQLPEKFRIEYRGMQHAQSSKLRHHISITLTGISR